MRRSCQYVMLTSITHDWNLGNGCMELHTIREHQQYETEYVCKVRKGDTVTHKTNKVVYQALLEYLEEFPCAEMTSENLLSKTAMPRLSYV